MQAFAGMGHIMPGPHVLGPAWDDETDGDEEEPMIDETQALEGFCDATARHQALISIFPCSNAPKALIPGGVNSPVRAFKAVGGAPL